jgi:hypothetical protein
LVVSGLLSSFTPNIHITNKLILPFSFKSKNKIIGESMGKMIEQNKKDWEESYYYLTGEPFKNLKDFFKDIKNKRWYLFYAMDWISQISFFKHYIYHQILYVTGATGQGKSTQIPKLLLYSLKMIDYKIDGNIICTVPRVSVTLDNSTRIAEELGVPIEETIDNFTTKNENK